jgi:RNA polymerase sigma-70 factor, ECF subfamily
MGASLDYAAEPSPEPSAAVISHEALRDLYEQHFAFVWRSLRALGVQPALLDDAVQEVFLVVHRRGKDFEGRSAVRTWLFGIAYRVAANFRRSARRRPTDPLSEDLTTDRPDPEQTAAQAEAARFVEAFLAELDDHLRAAFTACVLEEMSGREAAEALGVNVNTLASRLRIARERFAARMAKRSIKP